MDKLQKYLIDTWRFYSSNFASLASIVLILTLPIDLIALLDMTIVLVDFETTWYFYALHLIAMPLYLSALVIFIASKIAGDNLRIKDIYKTAIQFWIPIAIIYLITTIAIALGLFLLVIPGLVVFARTAFAQFFCVLDKVTPIGAIKKSWEATREQQWLILGGLILVYLASELPNWLVNKALSSIGASYPLTYFISSILSALLFAPPIIFAFRLYSAQQETSNLQMV